MEAAIGLVLIGGLLLALWLGPIWLAVVIADGKGRNPWVAAVLTLFLSLLGLLIVAVIPPSREAQLRKRQADATWAVTQGEAATNASDRECPRCGRWNPVTRGLCAYCGEVQATLA